MAKVTLEAPDISCDHCIASIQKAVTKPPAVQLLSGDSRSRQVSLEYGPASVQLAAIEEAPALSEVEGPVLSEGCPCLPAGTVLVGEK